MAIGRKAVLALALLGISFLAGYWLHQPPAGVPGSTVRQPLYYRDPMHPAYRSDKPGIAPDCGMQLEPVYADDAGAAGGAEGAMPPGAVRIGVEKQQIMGLRTAKAARGPGSHTLRVLGRVAVDETRIHRVTAMVDGVVRWVSSFTAGNLIQKDDLLASYFVSTRELYNAMQTYFLATSALDQGFSSNPGQVGVDTAKAQVRVAEELLLQFGVSEKQ